MLTDARIIEELEAVAAILAASPSERSAQAANRVMGIRLTEPSLRGQLERVTVLLDTASTYASLKALSRLLRADPTLLKLPILGFPPFP